MTFRVKQILCPVTLDGEPAKNLEFSLLLAKDFDAKIRVCFCTARVSPETPPVIHEKLNNLVRQVLDFYVTRLDGKEIEWESVVIENNDTAQGITDEAARRAVDLIVIGASRHPILHALLGSVTEEVCRTAPCPVIVTRQGDLQPKNGAGNPQLRNILVAHDFSDYSEIALQTATALTSKHNAALHLMQVIAEPHREIELAVSGGAVNNLYHQTIERLKTVVTGEFRALSKVTIAARWGKPYREILKYSKEHDIDLIAMGAHGSDFGSNTLFGSNVDRVLRQAPCAVLVARPRRPAVV
jgi:nucleotide-binding universal stress UspA family protein